MANAGPKLLVQMRESSRVGEVGALLALTPIVVADSTALGNRMESCIARVAPERALCKEKEGRVKET